MRKYSRKFSVILVLSVFVSIAPVHAETKQENHAFKQEVVSCMLKDRSGHKYGTTTVIGKKTRLTAYHVVNDCAVIYVGNKRMKVAYADPEYDIAVLGRSKDFSDLSCTDAPEGGVVSISGIPLGASKVVTTKGKRLAGTKSNFQSVSAVAIPGMSGGAVVNDQGKLIGITKSRKGLSEVSYVSGPKLCQSLSNYKGVVLSSY